MNLQELTPSEKILLADKLWGSVASDDKLSPLTKDQKAVLDAHLASYSSNPQEGDSWIQIIRDEEKQMLRIILLILNLSALAWIGYVTQNDGIKNLNGGLLLVGICTFLFGNVYYIYRHAASKKIDLGLAYT